MLRQIEGVRDLAQHLVLWGGCDDGGLDGQLGSGPTRVSTMKARQAPL